MYCGTGHLAPEFHTTQGKQSGLHSAWDAERLEVMEKAWGVATGDSVIDSGTRDMEE